MSRNTKTSSLAESAMICGLLVLMSMISFYVLPFLDFLFPLPAIILSKRRGYKYSALTLVAASLIIMMLLGFPMGIMYLVMYTPIGAAMSYLVSKGKKASVVIFGGSIAMLVSLIVMLYGVQLFTGVAVTDEITSMFNEMLKMQKSIMNTVGADEAQTAQMIAMLNSFSERMIILLPFTLILASLLIAVANYFLAQRLAARFKMSIAPLKDICMFYLPKNFIFGMGFLMVLAFVLNYMGFVNMDVILINISMLAIMALVVQGLAITKFYMIKFGINNLLRVIVFFCIIFIPIFSIIITMIAVVDLIIDFRKLRTKR